MTEAEKKEIVALVMSEISGQAVDFDLQTVTPQRTDILPAVRPDGAGGYTGVTLDWGGITDELTTQAKEFRNEALQAKKDTELLKGETNGIKSDVEYIYRQFNEAVDKTIESVRNVYQSDLNAESTARQTADNTLQQNIDSEASTRAEADTALGARIDSETTTRESEVAELERVNAIQKYEIENLKAKAEGQIYREEIIEANAYKLDVPSSVAPYAEVQRIGGKSVVWNQLVPPINKTQSANGITIAGDGSGKLTITVSSEVTGYNQVTLGRINLIQGHKYLMFDNDNENGFEFYINGYSGTNGKLFIFAANSTSSQDILYYVNQTSPSGTYIKHPMTVDLTQMFGSGKEPTLEECKKIFSADYYPYDAGTLKSFPVQKVRSVGRNLYNVNSPENTVGYGITASTGVLSVNSSLTVTPYIPVKEGETYYLLNTLNGTGAYGTAFYDSSKNYISGVIHNHSTSYKSVTVPTNAVYMRTTVLNSSKASVCINISDTNNGTFTPYKESALDLSSVTSDLMSAGSAHDEWSDGKVTKRIGSYTFTGNESWIVNRSSYTMGVQLGIKRPENWDNKNVVITDANLSTYVSQSTLYDGRDTSGITLGDGGRIVISSSDYANRDTLLKGKTVYLEVDSYEQTVPEIDNYIQVEGGGSLTFESDETVKMPVPSTTRFVVDLT